MKRVSAVVAVLAALLSGWFGFVIFSGGSIVLFHKVFEIKTASGEMFNNKNLSYIAMGAGGLTFIFSILMILKINSFSLAIIQLIMVLNVLLTILFGYQETAFGFTFITISSVAFLIGWLVLFL